MSDRSDADITCGLIIGLILAWFVAYIYISIFWESQAINSGAAHYEVNPNSGATKWVWDGTRPKPKSEAKP